MPLTISPRICSPNVSLFIGLEESKVDACDFCKVHVFRRGQFVSVVPLPRRIVAVFVWREEYAIVLLRERFCIIDDSNRFHIYQVVLLTLKWL